MKASFTIFIFFVGGYNVQGFGQIRAKINLNSKLKPFHFQLYESLLDEKTLTETKPIVTEEINVTRFSYGEFAKQNPFVNNLGIASTKTLAADLLAQVVIAQTPVADIDWQRSLLFGIFGLVYSGGFQYLYQVQVFQRIN
jgi:hypothetical protein